MKVSLFLLLLSLNIIKASIQLNILSSKNGTVSVKHKGINVSEVKSFRELALFGLSSSELREAVKAYFETEPDHIYLAEHLPFGTIHSQYCWEPLTVVSTVKSTVVNNVTSEPVVLATHDFENDSNDTTIITSSLTQNIENTIRTSWSLNEELAASLQVGYQINILFAKARGLAGFKAACQWGQSEEKAEILRIGTSTQVQKKLDPGKAATMILSANKGSIDVQVVYEASLRGNLGVSFTNPWEKHYYWGVPIENILSNYGISNTVKTVALINLGYYNNVLTKVKDL